MTTARKTSIHHLTITRWEPAPRDLTLLDDEIHVWCAELTGATNHLLSSLSNEERTRAQHFRLARDRDQFVIARGTLRAILAQYLNAAPAALKFAYEPNGKPYLTTASGARSPLHFNVSHTHGLALLAMAWHCDLGVDVEQMRPELADEMTAQQFLSAAEMTTFRQLPSELQATAFFNYWSCKEAYLKATGAGMSVAPETIAVGLDEQAAPQWIEVPGDVARWLCWHFVPQPGYVGALMQYGERERPALRSENQSHRFRSLTLPVLHHH
jgi:4'-phosphopantetheinyl transferase